MCFIRRVVKDDRVYVECKRHKLKAEMSLRVYSTRFEVPGSGYEYATGFWKLGKWLHSGKELPDVQRQESAR